MRLSARLLGPFLVASAAVSASQTFRSSVAMVHLPVIVVDRQGTPIRGLTAEDFSVIEAGHVQEVTAFAEGPPGPAVPLHLALMFDTSESMEKELDLAVRLGVGLVDGLPEASDVTLVEFDASVRISRFEPPSYSRLIERLRVRGKLGQRTALFDALGRYVAMIRERPGQHVVVISTDGADSSSRLNIADAVDLVRLGDVIVYAVGYLNQAAASDRARQQGMLTALSRETGGEAFFPSARRDLDQIVERIRAEIGARYTLGYVRPPSTGAEGFRRVQVRLSRPGLDGARVRARSGYVVERAMTN